MKHKRGGTPAAEPINWFAEIRSLGVLVLAVLAFHSLIAKPFYIPSISMMPNLMVGDRLIVSKYPYGWNWSSISFHLLPPFEGRLWPKTPEYGDIVILTRPDNDVDYIKRVVALPGDRIAVTNGQIILNGKPIPQRVQPAMTIPVDPNSPCSTWDFPGLRYRTASGKTVCELPILRETLPNGVSYNIIEQTDQPLDHMDETVIPPDHIWVMGDNRDKSADSRAELSNRGLGGAIPLSNVGGRAEFSTFSVDGTATWNPMTWFGSLRGDRAWLSLRPEKNAESAK